MQKPTCRRCGRQHYNMEPCSVATPAVRVLRRRPNDHGDRLETVVNLGHGRIGQARGPLSSRAA